VSLEQFIGACLGLVLIMLARLLDKWLPATESGVTAVPQTPPIARQDVAGSIPRSVDLPMVPEPPPDDTTPPETPP